MRSNILQVLEFRDVLGNGSPPQATLSNPSSNGSYSSTISTYAAELQWEQREKR